MRKDLVSPPFQGFIWAKLVVTVLRGGYRLLCQLVELLLRDFSCRDVGVKLPRFRIINLDAYGHRLATETSPDEFDLVLALAETYVSVTYDDMVVGNVVLYTRLSRHGQVLQILATFPAVPTLVDMLHDEGKDELKQIFEDVLEAKNKSVLGFASTIRLFNLLPNYFQDRFQKELRRRDIQLRDILSYESGQKVAEETKANAGWNYYYRCM